MNEMITYRGGCCGDFIRLLVSDCDYSINDVGKVIDSDIHDYTRFAFDMIRKGENLSIIIDKVKKEKIRYPNMRTDVLSSHDYYVFFERYKNADNFFKYVKEIGIDRVMHISITTEKSLRIRTLNSLIKNHSLDYKDYIDHYDKYGIYELEVYKNEAKIYLDSKRDYDIMLELECIYDKEYLRNFLLENYNGWSDNNFDTIYDNYMSKQLYLGDWYG